MFSTIKRKLFDTFVFLVSTVDRKHRRKSDADSQLFTDHDYPDSEKEENKGCVFPVMTRNSHEKGYNFIKISPHGTTLSDILLQT